MQYHQIYTIVKWALYIISSIQREIGDMYCNFDVVPYIGPEIDSVKKNGSSFKKQKMAENSTKCATTWKHCFLMFYRKSASPKGAFYVRLEVLPKPSLWPNWRPRMPRPGGPTPNTLSVACVCSNSCFFV